MKLVSTVCDEPGLEILRDCFGRENVRCYEDASEKFLKEAEVLVFLEWAPARELVKKMPNLRILQALSAGTDHIPRQEIPDGVVLNSNAGANAWAVAEHALALILAALKKIPIRDRAMRRGEFPQMWPSKLLRGKTVGIVGFGHIGQALARLIEPFNVRILAINRSGQYDGPLKVEFTGTSDKLDHVLKNSDIVVLTLPLTAETKGLITGEKLNLMRSDAVLVNVARGKIIKQEDLYNFLKTHESFVAALDTWWHYGENFKQDYPFETLDNVIITPHCAGVYETWLEDAMHSACKRINAMRNNLIPQKV